MSYSGDIYAFSLVRKHPHLETKVTILGNKVLTQSFFSTLLGLCWTVTIPRCVKEALAYLEPLMRSRDLSGDQRVCCVQNNDLKQMSNFVCERECGRMTIEDQTCLAYRGRVLRLVTAPAPACYLQTGSYFHTRPAHLCCGH